MSYFLFSLFCYEVRYDRPQSGLAFSDLSRPALPAFSQCLNTLAWKEPLPGGWGGNDDVKEGAMEMAKRKGTNTK